MSWKYCLTPRVDHWIFNIVLSKPYCETSYGEHFKLIEVNSYPQFQHIDIFRVYKDKYGRHFYFTFSDFETIWEFRVAYSITPPYIQAEKSPNNPYYRCLKISDPAPGTSQYFIFCLPSFYTRTIRQG